MELGRIALGNDIWLPTGEAHTIPLDSLQDSAQHTAYKTAHSTQDTAHSLQDSAQTTGQRTAQSTQRTAYSLQVSLPFGMTVPLLQLTPRI